MKNLWQNQINCLKKGASMNATEKAFMLLLALKARQAFGSECFGNLFALSEEDFQNFHYLSKDNEKAYFSVQEQNKEPRLYVVPREIYENNLTLDEFVEEVNYFVSAFSKGFYKI